MATSVGLCQNACGDVFLRLVIPSSMSIFKWVSFVPAAYSVSNPFHFKVAIF
jgi:hypothetical protein